MSISVLQWHSLMSMRLVCPTFGMMILYDMFNKRDDDGASVFHRGQTLIRSCEEHIPLFALESQDPVVEFDFGITLGYEMCYTNVLQLLDLSGIPLLQKEQRMIR